MIQTYNWQRDLTWVILPVRMNPGLAALLLQTFAGTESDFAIGFADGVNAYQLEQAPTKEQYSFPGMDTPMDFDFGTDSKEKDIDFEPDI